VRVCAEHDREQYRTWMSGRPLVSFWVRAGARNTGHERQLTTGIGWRRKPMGRTIPVRVFCVRTDADA
jgi:hypothetical protein